MQQIAWQRELLRIITIVAISSAAGMTFDKPFWGALIGLVVSQVLMLKRLNELFLWSNKQGPAPIDSGLVGYSVDVITRRERFLNKTIKKHKKQLKRITQGIESLNDGILITNQAGFITSFNRASSHLLGLRVDTDKGQHITNLLRTPSFVKYFKKGDYREVIEFKSPYRNNLIVQIQVTQFGVDQKVIIIRDVTERQRVEQMRQHFIADVSHELRTPLTVISGYLEMLADADVNPGVMRAIRQMGEQSDRMKSLVNDLLHLSKLESNNAGVGSQWFELQSLCVLGVDQLRGYIPKTLTGEEVPEPNIDCDCASNIEVLGFSEEINSVLTNLMTNAIKYGRKEGEAAQIKIGVTSSAKGLEIAVSDKGDGIAPNHLSRLTERFYRVDESRESTVGGSGLGLAIVRHALEHHDAQLKIESTVGEGSCFSFVIPAERIRIKGSE
ncbi:MAG TPA: phosphate regulon sensor histidine kinase PhoR [Oceanospirillales bacterium]|nr:phosphate regulon sensor histidine kinase PhoR [Oceanospirillales bacterium]